MGRSFRDYTIESGDVPALDETDYYDDGMPFANPAIRTGYENALGEFMVAFNELDDFVTTVVGYAYQEIERKLPANIKTYAARVDLLDVFGGTKVLLLENAPIAELRELGKMRNFLAHGHFDQNPFDGSYVVKPRSGKSRYVKAESIRAYTTRAFEVIDKLRAVEAVAHIKDTTTS